MDPTELRPELLRSPFGAQELVRDVISGFFLILDGVIEQGDVIEIDAVPQRWR